MADRRGRKRQRRCCRIRCAGEKLDRLRGVCLCHQEQACLRTGAEQGGAVRSTWHRDVPGRRRERQLGRSEGLLPCHAHAPGKTLSITATAFVIMYKQPKDFGRRNRERFFQVVVGKRTAASGRARLRSASAFSRSTDRKLLEFGVRRLRRADPKRGFAGSPAMRRNKGATSYRTDRGRRSDRLL